MKEEKETSALREWLKGLALYFAVVLFFLVVILISNYFHL
jgi:hypothetical protein